MKPKYKNFRITVDQHRKIRAVGKRNFPKLRLIQVMDVLLENYVSRESKIHDAKGAS